MKIISMMLLVLISTNVLAEEDDFYSYDQIVKELSGATSTNKTRLKRVVNDPFSNVLIHGGVGFTSSYLSLSPNNDSETITGFHSGIEATIGIDLFSRYWQAEGSVRSFGNETINKNQVSLKEFDLKIVYRDYWARKFFYRFGGGIAARYLKFKEAPQKRSLLLPSIHLGLVPLNTRHLQRLFLPVSVATC
ncbi:MAG: hypothetical protein R2827_08760 [Bdellovibrionales bacterium]